MPSRPTKAPLDAPRPVSNASFVYGDLMRARDQIAKGRSRGERTSLALKLALIKVLERKSYLSLRVSDICSEAEVSNAAFYLYYVNKTDITRQVLLEFLDALESFRAESASASEVSNFAAIFNANLSWLKACRANAGLVRCLLQLSDQEADFAEVAARFGHAYNERIAQSMIRRSQGRLAHPTALLTAYMMAGMVDDLSRRLFVQPSAELVGLVAKAAPTDEALAEALALIWYRAFYAADPPELHAGHGASAPTNGA